MPLSPGVRRLLHYYGYLQPILMIAAGLGSLVALVLWFNSGDPVETEGVVILTVVGLAGVSFGAFFLWKHSRKDPATPILIVDDLPPAEGARQTRRAMWILGIILTFGSALMAYQLMQLEFGSAQSVTVWGPVAHMYQAFGFWPAVLFVPALGVLIFFSLARKLRSIKESQTGRI